MHDDASPPPAGPLPRRLGMFSAIGIGAVLVGLAVSTFLGQLDEDAPVDNQFDPAPNFTVELLDGGTFDLDQHFREDGRPVILNFWASWCVPCRIEMPDFDQIAREKPGVKVIGIAVSDSTDSAIAFAEEVGVSYALGVDETEVISAAYPFLGLPSTWFIDENQHIVREFAGQVNAETLREFLSADFGI